MPNYISLFPSGTTTPQPTGVKEFQCWYNEIPEITPMIKPWPCCGLTDFPKSFSGTVSYSGEYCGHIITGVEQLVTWSVQGLCSNSQFFYYYAQDVSVGITFAYPCWTASEFYPSNGLFGFISNFNEDPKINSGGCSYDSKTNKWIFYGASYSGSTRIKGCTIRVAINSYS